MSATRDPRKPNIHLPVEMIEEMRAEAARQDRSLSAIVQIAWKLARERLRRTPEVVR